MERYVVRANNAQGIVGVWGSYSSVDMAEKALNYLASIIIEGRGFTLSDGNKLTKAAIPPQVCQQHGWIIEIHDTETGEVI